MPNQTANRYTVPRDGHSSGHVVSMQIAKINKDTHRAPYRLMGESASTAVLAHCKYILL